MFGLGEQTFDPNVQALQNALAVLAKASFRFDINPGSTDGVMTEQTATAVANSFNILTATSQLSYWERISIQGALIFGASTEAAQNAIITAAPELAAAALLAASQVQPLPGGGYYVPQTSWIGTPFGIGVILIGVILGYKLVTRGRKHVDG